jgi:hypothetical protein
MPFKPTIDGLRRDVDLPARIFLYTLDQVASMVQLDEEIFVASHVYLTGRSTFPKTQDFLRAHNIAQPAAEPQWRIAEFEVLRWMRLKGIRYREPGVIDD